MKKRLILLPLFIILLVTIISAPNHVVYLDQYDNQDYYYDSNEKPKIETTRVFHIIEDDGSEYYRTYTGFNKNRVHNRVRYASNQQRGIYRDFFDVDKRPNDDFCDTDCPAEWKCKKD
jgi:uncharacterized protein YxeA